jgi:hypothetical protein
VDTCSIYCSSSGYFVLCFSSNAETLLKAFSASPMFPKVLFYELLDSVTGYLLDKDLLFYRLYLGLRLFGGRTLVHEFR